MSDTTYDSFEDGLIADMRANGGRITTGPLAGHPLLVMISTGAASGKPRRAILTFSRDNGDYVVAGTANGAPTDPAWVSNLRANPMVAVEAENRTFEATAAVLSEGAERDRLWNQHVAQLPHFAGYEAQAGRVIPVIRLTSSAYAAPIRAPREQPNVGTGPKPADEAMHVPEGIALAAMRFRPSADLWAEFPDLVPGVLFATGITAGAVIDDRLAMHQHLAADRLAVGWSASCRRFRPGVAPSPRWVSSQGSTDALPSRSSARVVGRPSSGAHAGRHAYSRRVVNAIRPHAAGPLVGATANEWPN